MHCNGTGWDQPAINQMIITRRLIIRSCQRHICPVHHWVAMIGGKKRNHHYKCKGRFLEPGGEDRCPSSTQPRREINTLKYKKSRSHLPALLLKHPYNTPGRRLHSWDEALKSNSSIYHFSMNPLPGTFNQQGLLKKKKQKN